MKWISPALVLALPLVENTRFTTHWERHPERLIRDDDLQGMGRFFGRRPVAAHSLGPWSHDTGCVSFTVFWLGVLTVHFKTSD